MSTDAVTDSTAPGGIELNREIAASPAAVFAALSTAKGFAQWFGGHAVDVPRDRLDFEATEGRPWSATMVVPGAIEIAWAGEIVEVTAPSRFVFTLTDQPGDTVPTPVVFDLAPSDVGTHLYLDQRAPGFTAEQLEQLAAGWGTFLDVLAEISAASGEEPPTGE